MNEKANPIASSIAGIGRNSGMVATRMEAERINLRAALRDYGLRRP